MNSENDPELSKKAMIDKRAKIKSLKDKMRALKNPTKEIQKSEETKEKENKEEIIKENNSKNILDESIKFDEENNKDEILNDKLENKTNESNDDNDKNENSINDEKEEINIEKSNNINNINENINNIKIDDSNENINLIEGNKLEFSSRSHSGSKISNKKEEKEELYSENEEKNEINIISSDKKEKEEKNIIPFDKKEEKKNNIKKEIKDINEKKTKSKILIKKVKAPNDNIENNTKINNVSSRTELTSNNYNKVQKKKDINSNILTKNRTIVTKIQRNPNKILKKSMTTYTNKLTKRKFDPVKFNEYLKGVEDYENMKKEKIKYMKKQEEEKELRKITYHPKINKESNLKFKVNPKNYSTVERLYTQDLIKRKEKKQILTKVYTPTFKPKLYTNKHLINKANQRAQNVKTEIYDSENNFIIEENEDIEDKNNFEEENIRRNNSVKKRMKEKIEDENDMIVDEQKIENKLRSLLFKNKKSTGKRNKSVEKRKKTTFNLD